MGKLQRQVLTGVLAESERPVSRIRLMKLLFILEQEYAIPAFNFFPYHYGPYSWMATRCLESLQSEGVVVGDRPELARGNLGSQDFHFAPELLRRVVREAVARTSRLSDKDLLEYVYGHFVQYTVLSRLGPRARRPLAPPAVFSIGYEGVTIDRFLNTLVLAGIQRLVDVRRNPISRRFGFSKSRLSSYCAKVDIEYTHIPELGIPSADRAGLSGRDSYTQLFARYEKEMLPEQVQAVARAKTLVVERSSALLCFEADPDCCHRSRLAALIAQTTELPVVHLKHQ